MKVGQATIILVTLACLASLVFPSFAYTGHPEKVAILQSCARLFGPPVDEKQNLFEVGQAFVLQVQFTELGRLERFAVRPKYAFNEAHPEWTEPDSPPTLSQTEFKGLVAKLGRLKSEGRLVKPRNSISVVTNSTAYYKETYKYAVLEWGELADRSGVRFFSINYMKSKA